MPSLDGLRGVAILLVVAEHTFGHLLRPLTGNYGVYIFFVLSGFLITTLLLKEKVRTGTISLRNFYIRRFLRIFPVAYLYIFVLVILNFLLHLGIPAASFIRPALYLQNTTIIDAPAAHMSHYWSLSIEEQFYLLFPFFIWRNLRSYVALACALIVLAPVISYLDLRHAIEATWFIHLDEILRYMPALLIGSIMSVVFFYRIIVLPDKIPFRSILIIFTFFAGWVIISMPQLLGSTVISFTVAYVMIAVMIGASLVPGADPVYKLLNFRALTIIGVYSYSIYIWQQIFTKHKPWSGLFPGADSQLLNFVALVIVVYVSYNFYEKKFLNLKAKFK